MLPCVCSVTKEVTKSAVRTSVTHSCATFLFLSHFDVICDLLLNRRTAKWNLFVNLYNIYSIKMFCRRPFCYLICVGVNGLQMIIWKGLLNKKLPFYT